MSTRNRMAVALAFALLGVTVGQTSGSVEATASSATPVVDWSNEARSPASMPSTTTGSGAPSRRSRADTDGNPATEPDASWRPLRPTPNFPEYPSAHACHSTAVAEALGAFFGTDNVPFTLDSRVTGTTRSYDRFHEVVKEVNWARVLAGFHFRKF